jgi:transcriptional adapter 2-alpha
MSRRFDIDPGEFQARKRRRLAAMDTAPLPAAKVAPTSVPAIHDIGGYLPGRLEFEHELDDTAEECIKDLEFGACLAYGGDAIPEDDADQDVRARAKWIEEHAPGAAPMDVDAPLGVPGPGPSTVREAAGKRGKKPPPPPPPPAAPNGHVPLANGHHGANGDSRRARDRKARTKDDGAAPASDAEADGEDGEEEAEEQTQPPPFETEESLAFKLSLIEMYNYRTEKRLEDKQLLLDRGLVDNWKKVSSVCMQYQEHTDAAI